ncbi:carboxymuconolactone decarboxylase family protein [Haladaptatus sp. GCM10025707]
MASGIRGSCGLSEYRRELVILTVARSVRADYEWHQHVPIALAGDVTEAEIRAISAGRTDAFADPEAALVAYAGRVAAGAVTDADHTALAEHFDAERIVGTNMLAGFYLGLARMLDALGVEPEESFVGWELENLS